MEPPPLGIIAVVTALLAIEHSSFVSERPAMGSRLFQLPARRIALGYPAACYLDPRSLQYQGGRFAI